MGLEWKSTKPPKELDKLLPSRPIKLMSSTSKNTMLTSRLPPLEMLLMLILPGRLNTMPKRDSHSIPQLKPGLLTCQTMLLRTQTSMSRPQPQLRKLSLMLPRLRKLPRRPPPHQRRKPPLLPQLLQLKLPHHSSNFTEAETSLKRDKELNLSHLLPNHHLDHHLTQAAHLN